MFTPGASFFRGRGSKCCNRISAANFSIVFHGSILRSFRDMTTEETTDGPSIAYLAVKADQQLERQKVTSL